MKVTYSSNNSGGSWWLSDDDWRRLEAAGWGVEWGNTYFCHSRFAFCRAPKGMPEPCGVEEDCPGHQTAQTADEAALDRYMGALAKSASIDAPSPGAAMRSFEEATGQAVSDEGCNCCGPPHSFSWEGGYASGDDCLPHLFEGKSGPTTLRGAWEGSE